jgi:hypothetical protein
VQGVLQGLNISSQPASVDVLLKHLIARILLNHALYRFHRKDTGRKVSALHLEEENVRLSLSLCRRTQG